MDQAALDFYAAPGPMTALPDHPALAGLPAGADALRGVVQGLLVHRDLLGLAGLAPEDARLDEQHLRSTVEVLGRLFALSPAPLAIARRPVDRVLGICRHYALLHTALLRAEGTPARVRCGFSGYFHAGTWVDHWIVERWDGARWVRDDPQVDDGYQAVFAFDFDPHDQPPGRFLTGAEAWLAARAGEVDPARFGFAEMWGLGFVAGNVVLDLACLNKVELLPWDAWGMARESLDPFSPVPDEAAEVLDDVARLVAADDTAAIRARYESDDRLRVPADIVSYQDGVEVDVHLDL